MVNKKIKINGTITQKIVKYIVGTLIAILAYIVIMILSCKIPYGAITDNLIDTSQIIEDEGLYASSKFGNGVFDNWSDALLINIMASQKNHHVIQAAIANYRISSFEGKYDEITCMKKACETNVHVKDELEDYSRYWLGFIFVLKCLTIFLDLRRIRFLLLIAYITLQTCLVLKMRDKLSVQKIVAYLVATSIVPTFFHVMCLSFSTDILIMQIFMLLVFYFSETQFWQDNRLFIYYMVGSITFFANFLSAPLYTLAFPLILEMHLCHGKKMKKVICSSAMLLFGYSTSLLAKQFLSKVLLGYETGMDHIRLWSGAQDSMNVVERWSNVINRFSEIFTYTNIVILLLVIVIMFVINIVKNKKLKSIRWEDFFVFTFLGILPFAWLFVFAKHAGHGFDSMYFAITIYAFMSLLSELFIDDYSVLDVHAIR